MRTELDFPAVMKLRRWWRKAPPIENFAAAYFGFEPEVDPEELPTEEDFAAIEAAVMHRLPDHLKNIH